MTRARRDANVKRKWKGRLPELGRETLDNFGNLVRHKVQTEANADILDGFASFPERYQRKDVRVHVHARTSLHDFCAIFEYLGTTEDDVIFDVVAPTDIGRATTDLRSDQLNQPMLVSIIKLFQTIEEIPSTVEGPTPGGLSTISAVWLQPLDSCLMFRSQSSNHVPPATAGGPPSPLMSLETHHLSIPKASRIPIAEDRELSIPCPCWRFVQAGELEHQPIEGGSEIVDDLSDPDTPLIKRGRIDHFRPIDILSRLRIHLRPDDLILGLTPAGFLKEAESLDFTYCTPYLEAWAIQRMHEVYSHHEQQEQRNRPAQADDAEGRAIPSMDAP